MEEYKVIEGGYQVYPQGYVKSLKGEGKIKPYYHNRIKTHLVRLYKHPKKTLTMKNLIATLFIDGFDVKKHAIEFKDGNNTNFDVNNLRVVNRYKQRVDPERVQQVKESLEAGLNVAQVARKLGLNYAEAYYAGHNI